MKVRKLTSALLAGALLASVAGTALAAESVPGDVYGVKPAAEQVTEQAKEEIRKNLENSGLSQAEIEKRVEEQVQAKVIEVVDNKLKSAGVKDVPATHWAGASIAVMVEAGFIAPDTKGELKPEAPASKQETAAIFAKVLGLAPKTATPEEAAKAAAEVGLTNSVSADQDMSRMDVAKMLAKALGVEPKANAKVPFNDVSGLSADDQALLAALYDAGVFKGFPDGSFKPDGVLTKAQIAILIDRVLGLVK